MRWERNVTTDKNLHQNLSPFETNLIGVLYLARSSSEIAKAYQKSKQRWTPGGPVWEEGDFPEVTDPKYLPYEFIAVYASLISLMTSVKDWMCRRISGMVQVCADNMYDPMKGVPNMYWFNTGVIDAKGIHFPTVNALQLGRAHPKNKVL